MPTAESDDAQVGALIRTNHWRTAAGLLPVHASRELEVAATNHSRFMATTPSSCWPGAHGEVASCMGFTGADPGSRVRQAGFPGGAAEVINWDPNPVSSIDGWVWTVYHRQPFVDARWNVVGYGSVPGPFNGRQTRHNTMEFGSLSSMPRGTIAEPVIFPPPGTTGVPPGFRGDLEGPRPPAPRSTMRWPSGQVITVTFPSNTVTILHHRIYNTLCEPLVHSTFARTEDAAHDVTGDRQIATAGFVFLYADTALQPNSDHTVELEAMVDGRRWYRVWSFRTR